MMPFPLRMLVVMLAIALVAHGLSGLTLAAGSIGGPLMIRPLSEITADGPRVSNINPTHATLELITTIPVACAVIYGTDDAFGQIAIDPEMAGAAMIEHQKCQNALSGLLRSKNGTDKKIAQAL